MAERELGQRSSLLVGLTVASKVEHIAPKSGCDEITYTGDADSRVVPGGGNYEITEVVDQKEIGFAYSIDENDFEQAHLLG